MAGTITAGGVVLNLPQTAAVLRDISEGLEQFYDIQQKIDQLAGLGEYDGAHHKDWVIQEMWRVIMGWDEAELQAALDFRGWERGTAP